MSKWDFGEMEDLANYPATIYLNIAATKSRKAFNFRYP